MRAIGYFSEFPPSKPVAGDGAPLADGARHGPSQQNLSQQNDAFLTYCDAHGAEPAAAFLDPLLAVEESRAEGDRSGFRQLLDYLDRPEKGFLTVVVASFAHLGADLTEAARAYFQVTGRGAQVASIAEGDLDSAAMVALWREDQPSEPVGERVRDAMRRRAVKGQVLGRPPFGYRIGSDRRLAVVQEEAPLVRLIFDLYTKEGLGIRRIAKRLNAEGYRTRRDGNWSMVTIRDLLRNRAYVGTYARFGVRVPGNHPAIIQESQFKVVQARMAERRRPAAPAQPSQFLLSGLLFCGESGSRMIGVTRRQQWKRRDGDVVRNTYRYYQSEARTNQSVGEYYTRRADELEAEVLRHLTGEVPGAVRPAVLSAGDAQAVAAEMTVAEARVRTRMRSLDRRLSKRLEAAAAGKLAPERLRESGHEIAVEYRQAENELAALGRRVAAQASSEDHRRYQERQRSRVRTEWDRLSFDERQTLVRELVESVLVNEDSVHTVLRA